MTNPQPTESDWGRIPVPYVTGTGVRFAIAGRDVAGRIADYRYAFGDPRASSFSLQDHPEVFYPIERLENAEVKEG